MCLECILECVPLGDVPWRGACSPPAGCIIQGKFLEIHFFCGSKLAGPGIVPLLWGGSCLGLLQSKTFLHPDPGLTHSWLSTPGCSHCTVLPGEVAAGRWQRLAWPGRWAGASGAHSTCTCVETGLSAELRGVSELYPVGAKLLFTGLVGLGLEGGRWGWLTTGSEKTQNRIWGDSKRAT